jgi:diguanylate cyclase (GGDEF)-like protein/PAS domain S-box-containing protein
MRISLGGLEMTEKSKEKDKIANISEKYIISALMDYCTDSIYFKDLQSRFILANKALLKKLGMKNMSELIGKTDEDLFTEEHAKEAYAIEQKIIETGIPVVDIEEKETWYKKGIRWVSTTKMSFYDKEGNIMGTFGISRDITDRKMVERKLEKQISFMDALMEGVTDSIYFKDLQSRFLIINNGLARKLGIKDPKEAIGKTDFHFFTKEHAQQAYAIEQKIIETGIPVVDIEEKETWYKKGIRWVSTTKMPFYDKEGNIMGTFGISRDITDRKKAEEKVQYLYCHDQLTGLYNRTFFDEELNRIDTDRQLPITIVMGDVDKLKLINDTYGHLKGDILLKTIADIFKKCFRKEDIVSRWGGDEFIAILPKTEKKDALKIIKRIQSSCKKRNVNGVPVSISLGTSTKESSSKNILDILKEAEDKMYEKKIKSRKSIISLYSKDDKNTK